MDVGDMAREGMDVLDAADVLGEDDGDEGEVGDEGPDLGERSFFRAARLEPVIVRAGCCRVRFGSRWTASSARARR